MTTQENKFVGRVWVQPEPLVNLFVNPHAKFNLDDTGVMNAGLVRDTTVPGGAGPYANSFRLDGTPNNDSNFNVGGDAGGIRNGMEPGKGYTVRGTLRLNGALAGTAHARARRIVVFVHNTGDAPGVYTTYQSSQPANAAGTYQLSLEFLLADTVDEAFIRFYHGHTSNSAFWYGLRLTEGTPADVGTDFWDGDTTTGAGPDVNDLVYGWDGDPGNSSSYKMDRADSFELEHAELEVSYDADRTPFVTARVTVPNPGESTVNVLLEPRRSRAPVLWWTIDVFGRSPALAPLTTYLRGLPTQAAPATNRIVGKLWVDNVDEDLLPDVITLTANSGESLMDDKLRISTTTTDTGATTVEALVRYAITQIGEVNAIVDTSLAAGTAVPAGDRRLWLQGEPVSSLYEAELAAIDLRLYCDDRGRFYVDTFDNPPTFPPVGHRTITDGDGPFGTIISARRTRSRDGGGADGILVKADYTDAGGTRVVAYQRHYVNGVSSRHGKVVNLSRAIPSSTYAESIAAREQRRGEVFEIVAFLDTGIEVGRVLDLTLTNRPEVAVVARAITFRPEAGTMTIEAHVL